MYETARGAPRPARSPHTFLSPHLAIRPHLQPP